MNKMWVRLSVTFSLVMLVAAFLPILGLVLFSSETFATQQVVLSDVTLAIPYEENPENITPLGMVTTTRGVFSLESILFFLATVSVLIGTVAGLWVSRSISKPAMHLVAAVQAISKQNLSYRVPEQGSQELVDLARAINQMASDLENAEQARRNLLADVTHELRTPLTVLQGNLRAMLDGVYTLDDEEVRSLYGQTEHLGHLINDLHLLALAEAGQLPNAPQILDLRQEVRQIVDSFEALAIQNHIRLDFEAGQEDFSFEVDSRHLHQILHNLLSNAFKNTPPDGSITISLDRNPAGILLSVADTGRGIPPDELPFVFDRFYRKDETRRSDAGGSGLGLTITKKIIEQLHGSIEVRSEPGKGSIFTVHLPDSSAGSTTLSR